MSSQKRKKESFKLSSSDGKVFNVNRDLIKHSKIINSIIVELELDNEDEEMAPIHLDDVKSDVLSKLLEWFNYHNAMRTLTTIPKIETDITIWEKDFLFKSVTDYLNFILVSRSLDIPKLIATVDIMFASMMKNSTERQVMDKLLDLTR